MKVKIALRRIIKFLIDASLISLSYFLAFWLRFEGSIPSSDFRSFENSVLFLVGFTLIILFIFRLYHDLYEYSSIKDLISLIKALGVSFVLFVLILYGVHWHTIPRSVLLMYPVLALLFLGGVRFSYRVLQEISPRKTGRKYLLLVLEMRVR